MTPLLYDHSGCTNSDKEKENLKVFESKVLRLFDNKIFNFIYKCLRVTCINCIECDSYYLIEQRRHGLNTELSTIKLLKVLCKITNGTLKYHNS